MTISFLFCSLHCFKESSLLPVFIKKQERHVKIFLGFGLSPLLSQEINRPNNNLMLPFHFRIPLYIGENINYNWWLQLIDV